jgi:hypothetical protein
MSGEAAGHPIALLTPSFAPDLRDLAAMMASSRIILDDGLTWSRKGRITRARIRMGDAAGWLHIGIHPADRSRSLREARTDPDERWIDVFSRTLQTFYRGSFYYEEYGPWLLDHVEGCRGTREGRPLMPLLMGMRAFLLKTLHLEDLITKQVLLSDIGKVHHGRGAAVDPGEAEEGAEAVVDPWKRSDMRASHVLMEAGCRTYMKPHPAATDLPFVHPVYRQHAGGFMAGCSLLDLLFEMGPESWKVIDALIPAPLLRP